MAETSILLAGNLTSDPELRHSPGGTARASFRVSAPPLLRLELAQDHRRVARTRHEALLGGGYSA